MRLSFLAAILILCLPHALIAGLLPSGSPYVESGGIVQGEAEDYHAKTASATPDDWVEVPTTAVQGATFENAQGGLFFQCQNDNNTASYTYATGPSVDYKLQISTPGTYRLYLRWDGWDGSSDSIYAGILELTGASHADWYEDTGHVSSDFAQQNWDGSGEAEVNVAAAAQNAMTWTITNADITANAGIFHLRVVAREDGVALDAFRLQLNTLPDPNPVAVTSSHVIIGQDEFAYASGAIAGRNGGTNFDFDNTYNNNGFIGFTRQTASTWDAQFGTPLVNVSGQLTTSNAGARREYGSPSETNGAVNEAGSSAYKQVYYRVQMTRATGVTWSGISSYDFGNERVFFGVPADVNPASGFREFGIGENGVTYSGIQAVTGQTYTLVAKLDFVNDTIALYVNPDLTKPESLNTPAATRSYTGDNWSSAVRLGSGSGTSAITTWDNLVVGTSWNAVQRAYPTNSPVTGADVIVGQDSFNYPGGNIVGRDGGMNFDFDNQNGDSFVGYTQIPSTWDNVEGFPYVDGARQSLATWSSSTKREYGSPTEANGAFSNAGTSQYKTLYYRFEMQRSGAGVTWSGVSAYDGNSERVLFGVPFAINPSSGVRELAIHNLGTNTHTYTGIVPVAGVRYNLVAKMDFVAGMVSLFVNPDFTQAEPPIPTATMAWTGGTTTALRFGSGGNEPTYWDDVAVTTSWAAMQSLYPASQPAPGADVLIGVETFAYPNGGIGGKTGGTHWDFENLTAGDGVASHTMEPSSWDTAFGIPGIGAGVFYTQDSGAIRQYNSTEADGAVNDDIGTVHKQVYCRFEMTRGEGATWSGASLFDFGNERLLFGVPFATNPTSGNREFAIHDLATGHTYSGVQPVAAQTYTIVARLDYVTNLVSMWVNPDLTLPEASNPPLVTRPYTALSWNTAIRVGSGGSAATAWDNIAVGTSWRSIQSALGPPLAVADAVTLRHGQKVLLDLKRNDAGAGDVEIVTAPTSGSAVLDADGRVRYQHTTGTPASDTMSYRLVGITGQNSTPVNVTFNFTSAMRLPNTTSTVPLTPPSTGLGVVDALPGVTFTTPSCMTTVPGSTTKLIVGERGGKLWLVPDVSSPSPTKQLFLDVAAVVNPRATEDFEDDGNELGLKGVAFHPQYANNGQFFVTYCLKIGGQRYVRVSRFNAVGGNLNLGDTASEQPFISQSNPSAIHNLDMCVFGPDGYLYFTSGDAGGLDDGAGNSQRIDKDFWSAVFRIDVDRQSGNLEPNPHAAIALNPADGNKAFYKVPANNPFVGATTFNGEPLPGPGPVRTEIYANGFRNPWQISFDSQAPHEMWGGEVGLDNWEEVNLITAGGNYGWGYKEANANGPKANPPTGFNHATPLWTYSHGGGVLEGRSVTGGVVYRGTKYPTITGKYVFSDFVSGHIWTLTRNGVNPPTVERIAGESGIVAFNFDPSNGDILMLDYGDGKVRRLTTQTVDNTFPAKLSDTGLFADLGDLTVNPGIEAYDINLPFWSDFARKSRWFTVPDAGQMFGYVQDGNWSLPQGAIWIKHFDMDLTRGNPLTAKRLETRLLVKNAAGSYGVSYRWNEAGTEAYLVDDNGADFDLNITTGSGPYVQHWRIPSRAECMNCHTPQGGHALSWETRQLNKTGTMAGLSGNYLSLLTSAGYLTAPPSAADVPTLPKFAKPDDTTHTLETRARSWLAVNCSYCHQSGGTGVGLFDLRPELSLTATNIIDGTVFNPQQPDHRAIVRGQPAKSVLLNRMAAANGYTRMPPLATAELDDSGIQVVTDWINEAVNRSTYQEWRIANFSNGTSPDGAQTFDADGDGQTNWFEFLGMTQPQNGGSTLKPSISTAGGNVTVEFPNLPGRLIKIETSTDLTNWTPWNMPGNNGLPVLPAGGNRTFIAPMDTPHRFFRLEVKEQ